MNTITGPQDGSPEGVQEARFLWADQDRQRHVDMILGSSSHRRIVVAGPGTGKTMLFKQVLQGKKNALMLTFVNSLVEDLSLELCGLAEVRTLHSFARSTLRRLLGANVSVFPKLSEVITDDGQILLGQNINFDQIFHERDDANERIQFYADRRRFYGNYYGHTDIVFETVKLLEQDKERIPTYDQIVVDEFQDFNELEVSLIEALSTKSPILVTGDDDQALYAFKHASTKHIRERYRDKINYEQFTLPYCSRCTRVIVEAVNDVVLAGMKKGYLSGRIPKDFRYFEERAKNDESNRYPNISYKQCFARQIPWFIETQINKIAEELRERFSVLIICPIAKQCQAIAAALRKKGFQNVDCSEKRDDKPVFLDGLRLLLEDDESNLGWRIVCKSLFDQKAFINFLKEADKKGVEHLNRLVDRTTRAHVNRMRSTLQAVSNDTQIKQEDLDELLRTTEIDPYVSAKSALRDEVIGMGRGLGGQGVRKLPIKITTIQSSKGLARDLVFIANFDDQYFLGNGGKTVFDKDICSFLVAMTRARTKLYLISSQRSDPTFLNWINVGGIERL